MARINEDVKIEIRIDNFLFVQLDKGNISYSPSALSDGLIPLTRLLEYLIAVQNASLNQQKK